MTFTSNPSSTAVAGTNAATNATGENHARVLSASMAPAKTVSLTAKPPRPTAKIATGEIRAAQAIDSPFAPKFAKTIATPIADDQPALTPETRAPAAKASAIAGRAKGATRRISSISGSVLLTIGLGVPQVHDVVARTSTEDHPSGLEYAGGANQPVEQVPQPTENQDPREQR